MATVAKRTWTTRKDERKTAWVLTYHDRHGKRHRKQFRTKAAADAERVRVEGQLASGTHVPDRDSLSVEDAAKAFLLDFQDLVADGRRERSTLKKYREHIELHLKPFDIAKVKLSRLSGPDCAAYAKALETNRSEAMGTRVFATFRQVLDLAWSKGWIHGNPASAVSVRTAGDRDEDEVQIPPKDQVRKLIDTAKTFDSTGRAHAMVTLLAFGGLRASEMRALGKFNCRTKRNEVAINRRADEWQKIGTVKSRNSRRTVPLPQLACEAIERWLPAAPDSDLDLAFPTGTGTVESYTNLYNRLWVPLMDKAGLTTHSLEERAGERPEDPKVKVKVVRPLFALHALRHVAVSLWIEQGASPKQVQTWAGHASIQFTMDTYGHLWRDRTSETAIVAAAERSIANAKTEEH